MKLCKYTKWTNVSKHLCLHICMYTITQVYKYKKYVCKKEKHTVWSIPIDTAMGNYSHKIIITLKWPKKISAKIQNREHKISKKNYHSRKM